MSVESVIDEFFGYPSYLNKSDQVTLQVPDYNEGLPELPKLPVNSKQKDGRIYKRLDYVKKVCDEFGINFDDFLMLMDGEETQLSNESLRANAAAVLDNKLRKSGVAPKHYDRKAICRGCGPVWLWRDGLVDGCPWCWNRSEGLPIPRPQKVTCDSCNHFKKTDHPHLGKCSINKQQSGICGNWGPSKRTCDWWVNNV